MATLNAVIVPAKALKGGRHKIRISVAHNGETRYMVTNIIIDSAKEFKNGQIVKRPDAAMLNTKLRGLLQRYQEVIDDLLYVDGLTCPELVYQLRNGGNSKHRTLGSIVDEYLENSDIKPSSLMAYRGSWKRASSNIDSDILVENLNHLTMLRLRNYLYKQFSRATATNDLVFVMSAINYAKRCGYVQYRIDPCVGLNVLPPEPRQSWLSTEEVKTIRDLKIKFKVTAKVRDFFMLSYYLGGINMADLCKINFNENRRTLHYVRTKTENKSKVNKFVEFEIPEEALEIINRYKQPDGRLEMTDIQRKERFSAASKVNMKKIARMTGISQLIFYSARKSFSQHAFKLGVSESVIDYILGHKIDKGGTSLFNYISVTPEMATAAIRKVLDNLK